MGTLPVLTGNSCTSDLGGRGWVPEGTGPSEEERAPARCNNELSQALHQQYLGRQAPEPSSRRVNVGALCPGRHRSIPGSSGEGAARH